MTLPVQMFDFYTCTQVLDQYRILIKKLTWLSEKKGKRKKSFCLPT